MQDHVKTYRAERIVDMDGGSITATELYEDYCEWCDEQWIEPLDLPVFGRYFSDLGIDKAKLAGRVRYIGIARRVQGNVVQLDDHRHKISAKAS